MRDLPPELVPLLNGLPPAARADVQVAIESSTYLSSTLVDAARQDRVGHIAVTTTPHQSGHYDFIEKTIFISAEQFTEKNAGARVDNITATLGHEASHAYFSGHLYDALERLDVETNEAIVKAGPGGRADLTDPFERYLLAAREGEALAEIGGMNALASRVREQNGGTFDRKDFLARADATTHCISPGKGGAPAFARDIRMSDDGLIYAGSVPLVADKHNPNPNREAVALCHFDLPPKEANLGQAGASDYQNYYGTRAITAASSVLKGWHNPPEVALDLERLKLDPTLIERSGLDLGGPGKVFSFIDTSQGGMNWTTLHNTKTEPSNAAPDVAPEPRALRADSPGHPDHAAFEMFHRAAQADGRWSQAEARNLAAAGLAAVKADPTVGTNLTGVVIGRAADGGTNLIGYASPHGPAGPHHHLAIDAGNAAQAPAEKNLDRVEQLNRQQAQQQAPPPTQGPDGPPQAGPKMTL
ncbi:hypothetical protein [Lysobacter enzymogenes]|uniref:hypothetical protein n=1 Tax=Lysobacter enzymogenes TaxID=69 RepID=UPI00089D3EB6|nr:hypothetical protein [Lysobacter enzymogenes]SDX84296.1 hypothetical protein SAMN05421681_108154 [Lysobacter enzymogenes]